MDAEDWDMLDLLDISAPSKVFSTQVVEFQLEETELQPVDKLMVFERTNAFIGRLLAEKLSQKFLKKRRLTQEKLLSNSGVSCNQSNTLFFSCEASK